MAENNLDIDLQGDASWGGGRRCGHRRVAAHHRQQQPCQDFSRIVVGSAGLVYALALLTAWALEPCAAIGS